MASTTHQRAVDLQQPHHQWCPHAVSTPQRVSRPSCSFNNSSITTGRRRTVSTRGRGVQCSAGDAAASAAVSSCEEPWRGPVLDWSRHNLSVLFVDSSDQLRAKLAASFFEQVAEWNGYARCLLPTTAGLRVAQTRGAWDLTMQASLMARAYMLGLPPRPFARSPEPFELRDLDEHDVIVAVDSATRRDILARVDRAYLASYEDKVRVLSEYAQQAALADSEVLAVGGLALLPRRISVSLRQDLGSLRRVVDMPRPSMTDPSKAAAARWETCIRAAMLGAAGLTRFLIDSHQQADLPEYDPID